MSIIRKKAEDNLSYFTKDYTDNIILRGLMQFSPISAAIDVAITSKYAEIIKKRNAIFFQQLENGEIELTQDIIDSNEFVQNFFITYNAAMRTKSEDKIKLFANFFKNFMTTGYDINFEEYEEINQIIEDISFREFLILSKIYKTELQYPSNIEPNDNDYKRALRFWYLIEDFMINDLCIPKDEHESVLIRLARTGLYITFKGLYHTDTKGLGKTTKLFDTLVKLLN